MTEHHYVCPKCGHVVVTYVNATGVYHACLKERQKPVALKEVK